jgi:RNA polymerase sigma-70 factor, ECF subfamily
VTDDEILRQVQAGDRTALRALYERYLPSVWRYVSSQFPGNEHLAQDVVSETFLAAVRAVGTLPRTYSLTSWLIGIARHKIGDQRRRARLDERTSHAVLRAGTAQPDSQALLEAKETRAQVAAVMEQLSDDERLILEWKYLEDLSVRQIADRLGRTEKAIEALLYRARRSFRALLKPDLRGESRP